MHAIHVAPGLHGRGIGRRLLAAGEEAMRSAGFRRATLWVIEENAEARRFYEAAGWRPDGLSKRGPMGGFAGLPVVNEVRYVRAARRSEPVAIGEPSLQLVRHSRHQPNAESLDEATEQRPRDSDRRRLRGHPGHPRRNLNRSLEIADLVHQARARAPVCRARSRPSRAREHVPRSCGARSPRGRRTRRTPRRRSPVPSPVPRPSPHATGAPMPFRRPARDSATVTPRRSSSRGSRGPAEMTPMEPTMAFGLASTRRAAIAAR